MAISSGLMAMAAASQARPRAGCQTNAWRVEPGEFSSLLAVLDRIRHFGYAGFETGFRNLQGQFANAAAARRELERRGLAFPGCHIFLTEYDPKTLLAPAGLAEAVIRGAAALGAERLILSGGSSGGQAARAARKGEALNRYGKLAREAGMHGVAYHNHWAEFEEGGWEIERLLAATDGETVRLIVDAGHAIRAKADVARFFTRHHARIGGIHLRDFRGAEQVPLGEGSVDWKPLAEAIGRLSWSGWLINEEERLGDGKPGDAAVEPARRTLRSMFGV